MKSLQGVAEYALHRLHAKGWVKPGWAEVMTGDQHALQIVPGRTPS